MCCRLPSSFLYRTQLQNLSQHKITTIKNFHSLLFFIMLIKFNLNSNCCLSFSAIVVNISPAKKLIIAVNSTNPHTINVGKLGTKPVCTYLITIGINAPPSNNRQNCSHPAKKSHRLVIFIQSKYRLQNLESIRICIQF